MERFEGKAVLVTGGTSGIGLTAARLFLQEGARLAITGADPDRLAEAAQGLGDDVLAVVCDSTDLAQIEALAGRVTEHLGRLDVLFLNAGTSEFRPHQEIDEAFYDRIMAVNLKGSFFTLRALVPLVRDGGSIVVTTSNTNELALPGSSVYAAAKAGLRSLVRTFAGELLPRGIRVNAVSPGPTDTPLYAKLGLPADVLAKVKSHIAAGNPLGRFATSDEIAHAALFLASDEASYIVGEELVVDGGVLALTSWQ